MEREKRNFGARRPETGRSPFKKREGFTSSEDSRGRRPRVESEGDRPRRSFENDRPRRSFDQNREERPRRRFDNDDERPRKNFDNDRPRRRFDDNNEERSRRRFDNNDERPRRNFDNDRPRRRFDDNKEERPRRRFDNNDERPRRNFDNDRPQRRDDDRGERPRRNFDNDRPRRRFDDNEERPRRRFDDDRGERPRRNFDNDRPRRSFNDRDNRRNDDRRPRRNDDRGDYFDMDKSRKTSEESGLIRLNKYISNSGICSRREADELIAAGAVTVNGEVITEMGYKVTQDDIIVYGGEKLVNERKKYLLLNKPKGYITTLDDPQNRKTVMMLIHNACKERIYPVGRLDRNTSGLLLFTNDGEMTKKLTHPSFGARKIYHVEVDKPVTRDDMDKLMEGVNLEDGVSKADAIEYVGDGSDKRVVGIELHSGKNRIVRRMFESLGYEIFKLDRVFFAGLTKKDLPRGNYRFLTDKEVDFLKMTKSH